MSPRRPPDEPKDRAPDEIPIAPPEDRDPPEDRPGQKSAEPKDDPSSSKSPKKARPSRRVRISQDLEALEQRQGAGPALDDEAPMSAIPTKPNSAPKPVTQRVTKPKVQNRVNLKATCLGRHKVERGVLRWYWRIDRCPTPQNGLKKRETAKCLYATVEEVQAELEELVRRGEHRRTVANDDSKYKISDLMAMEIEACTPSWARRTAERVRAYHQALVKYLGDARVDNNAGRAIEAMYTRMREDGYARLTAKGLRLYLKRSWVNQISAGRITTPWPVVVWNWPKSRREGTVRYTPPREHIRQVINFLTDEAQLVVRVMAVTGARVGEVGGLRRCDYDPVTKVMLLNGKTGPRRVPADDSIQEALAARADGSANRMFNCTAPPDTKKWVNHRLDRACRILGIPSFSSHALRRAAIDHLYNSKADPSTVAKLMGHNVEVALKHYWTPTDDSVRRVIDSAAMGDFVGRTALLRNVLTNLTELMLDKDIQKDIETWEAIRGLIGRLGRTCTTAQQSTSRLVQSSGEPDAPVSGRAPASSGPEHSRASPAPYAPTETQALASDRVTAPSANSSSDALDSAPAGRRQQARPNRRPAAPATSPASSPNTFQPVRPC
ncbi:tyrosine-type recombinase/integrase, partial [Myxococcota bacterium]|nr:tyrosine-type recombinase/integrase [Myxococcota bacterium]